MEEGTLVDSVNVLVDIETLNNHPWGGVILEIGACVFPVSLLKELVEIVPEVSGHSTLTYFHRRISVKNSLKEGLTIDGDTLKWWLHSDRREYWLEMLFDQKVVTYKEALLDFRSWLGSLVNHDWKQLQMWSHGSNYDLAILGNHYRTAFSQKPPWQYKNENDTRTVIRLYKARTGQEPLWEINPFHHNGLADACVTARVMQRCLAKLMYNVERQT